MIQLLPIIAFISFSASLFARTTDPLVPQIARDFAVESHWAALLGSAFALPWALMQPILGPLGDLLGKARIVTLCLCVLVASAAVAALATTFPVLFLSRVIGGAAAGGVNPVAMAIVSDLVPFGQRQVAMGRVLTASISGVLLGGAAAGVVADMIGWRSIFVIVGAGVALATVAAATVLRRAVPDVRRPVSLAAIVANYRVLLANPRTKICYGAVFVEGVALFGIFPFVALLLVQTGETRASIAGLVVSAFALGGIVYSLAVRFLLSRFSSMALLRAGGVVVAIGLLIEAAVPAWPVQALAMTAMGFGFYLMHSCIMVEMTELAPQARGTAMAGHACSYFLGQAIGPAVYALCFATVGPTVTMVVAGAIIALTGFVTARRLLAIPRG